jgi:hypothetical protein
MTTAGIAMKREMSAMKFQQTNPSSSFRKSFPTYPTPTSKPEFLHRIWRLTLFPQLGLSLLHRSDNHVTNTSVGQPVETGTETEGFNYVERLGATVVGAIDDGTDGQTESQTEFCARGSSTLIGQANEVRAVRREIFFETVVMMRERDFFEGEGRTEGVSAVLDKEQRDVPRFAAIFE